MRVYYIRNPMLFVIYLANRNAMPKIYKLHLSLLIISKSKIIITDFFMKYMYQLFKEPLTMVYLNTTAAYSTFTNLKS
jgi:hypothetical protein